MRLHIGRHRRRNLCRDVVRMERMRLFNAWAVPDAGAQMVKGNPFRIRPPPAANRCVPKSTRPIYDGRRCARIKMEINVECVDDPINGCSTAIYSKYLTANTIDSIQTMQRLSIKRYWSGNSQSWMRTTTINCRKLSAKSCDDLCER